MDELVPGAAPTGQPEPSVKCGSYQQNQDSTLARSSYGGNKTMRESRYNIWVEKSGAMYVFNGVSGALLRISTRDYQSLRRFLTGEDEQCAPKVLASLASGLMLVPDNSDEIAVLAERYQRSRYDTSQFGLTIVTSLGCNFDCPYCFEAKHPSIMDDEVQQVLLNVVDDQLHRIKNLRVTWFGGEPLVGKKAVFALSRHFIDRCDAAQVGYSATITTNGFLLDEETCDQLRASRVESAQVCLDGPPEVHDQMRPLAGGKGTFWQIVENLRHAAQYLNISVRVNVDKQNLAQAERLMQILVAEGFAGRIHVYPGQIVGVNDGVPSPSALYHRSCFTNPEFARAELEFIGLAHSYGFATRALPSPVATPCTAVRANELVVGSKGEMYKCWESVGNPHEVIGNIREYKETNGRLQKWLKYDPFCNTECRNCIALPVCMGGCASHAMDVLQYENRCGTFRHTYQEQILAFAASAEARSSATVPAAQLTNRMETR